MQIWMPFYLLWKFLRMDVCAVIWQILFLISFVKMLAFGFVGSSDERKCKFLRVDKLFKIRCYDMNLKEVPQYLKSSVEVLDLSFNRIKKLKRSSFQPYSSIKYLLLYENMIQSVEPGTFAHLTSLQEIDLSNNALMTIPLELLQLPSMRNLYIDSNELTFLERDLEALETPIKAPLEYLNVADCGLQDIPDLGILPKLWHINVSMNPLMDLTIDRFANFCNLKSIDLTRTQLSQCQCQQANNHFRSLTVKTKYVPVCVEHLDTSICPLPYNFTIDSEAFQTCKTSIKLAEARSMWLLVAGCAGGVLAIILMVWFYIYRKRKRRNKKLRAAASRRKSLVVSPKNAIHRNEKDFYSKPKDELLSCDTA